MTLRLIAPFHYRLQPPVTLPSRRADLSATLVFRCSDVSELGDDVSLLALAASGSHLLLSTPRWALTLDMDARVAHRIGSKARASAAARTVASGMMGGGKGACLVPAVEERGGPAAALVARPKAKVWKALAETGEVGSTLSLGPLLSLPATPWPLECAPAGSLTEDQLQLSMAPVEMMDAPPTAEPLLSYLGAWTEGKKRLALLVDEAYASAVLLDVDSPADARRFKLPGALEP